MSDRNDLHYDAFISYRHNEFDSFVAENLHRKLENFRLPKSVIPKVLNGKKKIERVFRDVDELPLSDNLSDPISKALLNSDYLITICTPRYPESRWCMKEIEVFLQSHPRDHILVVLAEDEPAASFPEILCYDEVETRGDDGRIVRVRREIEPLAADVRGESKREVLKAMDTAVMRLCAAIFGLNYDDLRQRHREQRMRRLTAIFGSIGAAVLAFAIFATVMLVKISRQNVTISRQYDELQNSYASSMAIASDHLYEDGRRKDAAYAVRNVLPSDIESGYNAEAVKALYKDMGIYKLSRDYAPACSYDADSWLYYFCVSPDREHVLIKAGQKAYLCDGESGEVIDIISAHSDSIDCAFASNELIVYTDGEESATYDIGTGEKEEIELPEFSSFYCPDEGECLIAYGTDSRLCRIGGNGETVFETDLSKHFQTDSHALTAIVFDGERMAASFQGDGEHNILIIDGSDGTVTGIYADRDDSEPIAYLKGDILYTASTIHDMENGGMTAHITATDLSDNRQLWEFDADDIDVTGGEFVDAGDQLFFRGAQDVLVIDQLKGELLKLWSYNQVIIECWAANEELYILTADGAIYACDSYMQGEYTDSWYAAAPAEKVTDAEYLGGDLYCIYNEASYAVRYSADISPLAEAADGEYEWAMADERLPEDVFTDSDSYDVDLRLVDRVYYSDDGSNILVICTDHTLRILDAATGASISSYDTWLEMADSFRYSSVTGSYIISGDAGGRSLSYILDSDMKIICECAYIVCDEEGKFIMMDPDLNYYSMPFVDIAGLQSMADDYLGDHEPSFGVKQKYGLN
ncbi:toll/interleukin-1 receptor domain-containing protein [Butyrivibrio sp. MC2013]|uniref:toll/interleukin-1 receptor domain-containing protein n=1 Tax=Butyrivibrio sp. MC2013 TaxID=1280686 RepID=UPI0004086C13|nr:toll/interleukin-1 receptor domain-containing protein [Butyrivibrio sp. MC2013]